jgi:four helix bundle protein
MAKRVEELKVWQRANELGVAISAIIGNGGLDRDRRLREQILDATDSVLSNISEGFEQPTDRGFARYLYISKASNAEARTRLLLAHNRRYISADAFDACTRLSDEVARMLTGLIKYLARSDRRNRHLGTSTRTATND